MLRKFLGSHHITNTAVKFDMGVKMADGLTSVVHCPDAMQQLKVSQLNSVPKGR